VEAVSVVGAFQLSGIASLVVVNVLIFLLSIFSFPLKNLPMTEMKGNRAGLIWLVGLALAAGTLACYWPVRHFDFINMDDAIYVSKSRMVQHGLSWTGFVWAFKSIGGGSWNPLVWLSHMADYQCHGLDAGWDHLTNLFLHIANVLLLFAALRYMTGAIWRSGLVAAIFAWHPMHVESVAWIAERKDVLSTLFLFLAILTYVRFVKETGSRRKIFYGLTGLCFVLGLMSKPMLVTLPLIFLLLDYWPLCRSESKRALVLEKVPFLILSGMACLVTIWSQQTVHAMGNEPVLMRAANAVISYVVYLEQFFWPVDLAVFYPFPRAIPVWQWAGAIVALGGISWAVIREMKSRAYLAAGWLWFLGTLLPVIGFIHVGMQAHADRYTYISYLGLAWMISWGMADLARTFPRTRPVLAGFAVLVLAGCLAATSAQVGYWRDSTSLFNHALQVTSDNYVAYSNLGDVQIDEHKLDEAILNFREVVRLKPQVSKTYNNIGTAYALQGKLDDAITMFQRTIALDPKLEEAHYNLGNGYIKKGKVEAGIVELKTAVRLDPEDMKAQMTLSTTLIQSGKWAEAIPYCQAAVENEPQDTHARFNLGWAYMEGKMPEKAVASYKEGLRLTPDSAGCLNALAWIRATCSNQGIRNGAEAVRLATRACEISKRHDATILDTLACALAETGQFAQAIKIAGETLAVANSAHDVKTAELARQRMELFKKGKPYRE
jgi:tetratricopeptide (TPR) repeat protein